MIKDGGLSFKTQFKIEFLPPNNNLCLLFLAFTGQFLNFGFSNQSSFFTNFSLLLKFKKY